MARDGAPDSDDDETVVPITAPGSGPRDFAISPAPPAEASRSAERTSPLDPHAGRSAGPASRSSTAVSADRTVADNRATVGATRADGTDPGDTDDLLADDLLADDIDDDAIVGLDLNDSRSQGHVVGHDRLADVVATFGSTLDAIRASQGRAPRHNLPTGSGANQKRIAQVVQATPIDASQVVELIRSRAARVPLLALDADDPSAGRGDVVFPGRLRMPGGTRRRVELRVYPTASGNLTVLELLPRRSWMPQTRRYLRAGVPAITALSDAIEAAAAT